MFINVPGYIDTLTNGQNPDSQELLIMALSFAGNYQAFVKECEIGTILI